MTDKKIAFIGAGNMCRAIVNGLLTGGVCTCEQIKVYDRNEEKSLEFKKIGIYKAENAQSAVEFADFLFLAVKPQNYDEVLEEIKNCDFEKKTVVTIAAGISTGYICKTLGKDVPVVRVMPNTPMLVGMGAAGICRNEFVNDAEFDTVCTMFRVLGTVKTMNEDMLNKVIAVSGSSPAYVYLFIKEMINWATENGFDADDAKQLACAAVEGSAEMLLQSEKTPDELIKAVTSPGGTTLEAMKVFAERDFCGIIYEAMEACTKRAEELSR